MSARQVVCEDIYQIGNCNCFVCANKRKKRATQIRDAGCHALAADVISQAFIVVFFRHQVLQPLKRGLVLSTQKLWEREKKGEHICNKNNVFLGLNSVYFKGIIWVQYKCGFIVSICDMQKCSNPCTITFRNP